MTLADMDPVLSAPKRLGIMAILYALDAGEWVEFTFLREHLDIADADLSNHMSTLCEAGYATVRKSGHGPGRATLFAITPLGKQTYGRHVSAFKNMIDRPPTPGG